MRVLKRIIAQSEARFEWFFQRRNLLVMLAVLAIGVSIGVLTLQLHGDVWLAAGYILVAPMFVLALLMTPPMCRSAPGDDFPAYVAAVAFESADLPPLSRPPLS